MRVNINDIIADARRAAAEPIAVKTAGAPAPPSVSDIARSLVKIAAELRSYNPEDVSVDEVLQRCQNANLGRVR